MLGRQHFILSVATATVVMSPFFTDYYGFAIAAFLGVAIGSLIPDIDATDATVFHSGVKGLHRAPGKIFNDFIGPILPVFGYLTKYMIYKPSVFILNLFSDNYRFEDGHRSFTHSLIGVSTMTAATGLLLAPLFIELGLSTVYLLYFLGGYAAGAILHVFQDSCTKTGIAWNQPFSTLRLKGELKTGESNRRPRYFALMLFLVALLNLAGSYSVSANLQVLFSGILLSAVSWTFFAWLSGVRLER